MAILKNFINEKNAKFVFLVKFSLVQKKYFTRKINCWNSSFWQQQQQQNLYACHTSFHPFSNHSTMLLTIMMKIFWLKNNNSSMKSLNQVTIDFDFWKKNIKISTKKKNQTNSSSSSWCLHGRQLFSATTSKQTEK